jgi:hypothetical protein
MKLLIWIKRLKKTFIIEVDKVCYGNPNTNYESMHTSDFWYLHDFIFQKIKAKPPGFLYIDDFTENTYLVLENNLGNK